MRVFIKNKNGQITTYYAIHMIVPMGSNVELQFKQGKIFNVMIANKELLIA